MSAGPLAGLTSLKVKLGVLVAASVLVALAVATAGAAGDVPLWLTLPVTVALALAVTQLLAVGMTSPLREMTAAARRMATGDYGVRVTAASSDEVGELARAFNTMARDLASVDQQRRELVANVSHELRTPLTALCALLENLVDDVAPRDPATLATALGQAERLAGLVEDLLDLARVDAGKAPLDPEPVPLSPLLTEAVTEARALGRRVGFDVRLDPPDLVVRADPARLRQLVANLLDNASRHSPADGTVLVTAVRVGEHYRLEVHDDGPGIAPADRERVFEPFGTLAASDGGGGTGLGLAIARWVTELHGGTIRFVDPEPGVPGARIRVELPVQPVDRPPATRVPTAVDRSPDPVPLVVPPVTDDVFGRFWPDRAVPAQVGVLVGAAATGVLAGVVLPFRDAGLALFLVLLAAGAVVLGASRSRREPFTLVCAAVCVLLSSVAVLRDADWIIALCVLAGAALCLVGITGGRTLPGFLLAGLAWPLAGVRGLPWLGRTLAVLTGLGRGAALLRTVLWSLVGLVVFGALLVSADAVVAEWVLALLPDLSLDSFVLRVFLTLAVAGTVLAAAYVALNPPRVERAVRSARPADHRFEWLAPVLVVNAVFAVFLVAQASVVFGGDTYLRSVTGLTYAEYVHQGFGQLTVATALTLLVVWAAARKVSPDGAADRRWLRISLGLLCVQTLVVVASALYRMHVYQDAYGFTRLRLLVDVFEGWLGLLVLAVMVGGVGLRAAWFGRFALLTGVLALLGLALVNPDAWIAEHNIARYAETGRIDWAYLQGLSADAVPAYAALPDDLEICALATQGPSGDDWLAWNLGRARAADQPPGGEIPADRFADVCPSRD